MRPEHWQRQTEEKMQNSDYGRPDKRLQGAQEQRYRAGSSRNNAPLGYNPGLSVHESVEQRYWTSLKTKVAAHMKRSERHIAETAESKTWD